MSKGSTYESQLLQLLLQAKDIAGVCASTGLTSLAIGLHTGDPAGGTQDTNELSYSAYTRMLTSRSSGALGWTVSGSSPATASPLTAINFPQQTSAGAQTVTHMSIGASSTPGGGGQIFYSGTVTPNITMGANVTPQITTGSSVTEN